MIKFIIRFLITAVIVIVALFVSNNFWPDWWKKPFIPPMPVLGSDCSLVETEVNRYDWDKEVALAVAKAESACQADARGDEDLVYQENGREYGYSVGVFQVRILPGREECDTYNVATNVKCAYNIYRESGWGAWSMYQNGSYVKYTWRGLDKLF